MFLASGHHYILFLIFLFLFWWQSSYLFFFFLLFFVCYFPYQSHCIIRKKVAKILFYKSSCLVLSSWWCVSAIPACYKTWLQYGFILPLYSFSFGTKSLLWFGGLPFFSIILIYRSFFGNKAAYSSTSLFHLSLSLSHTHTHIHAHAHARAHTHTCKHVLALAHTRMFQVLVI